MPSRYSSKNAALSLSGQKNGLLPISFQSHLLRSILCGPICTSAPRTFTSGRIFRGMARAELVLDVGIVLGALVGVLDQERNRRARRYLHAALRMGHHAGEDFH